MTPTHRCSCIFTQHFNHKDQNYIMQLIFTNGTKSQTLSTRMSDTKFKKTSAYLTVVSITLGFKRSCGFQYGDQGFVKFRSTEAAGPTTSICKQEGKITTLFKMCPWPLTHQGWLLWQLTAILWRSQMSGSVGLLLLWMTWGESINKGDRGDKPRDVWMKVLDDCPWKKDSFFSHSFISFSFSLGCNSKASA